MGFVLTIGFSSSVKFVRKHVKVSDLLFVMGDGVSGDCLVRGWSDASADWLDVAWIPR